MHKKYPVRLTDPERIELEQLIAASAAPARKLMHTRMLLKADQGSSGPGWDDGAIVPDNRALHRYRVLDATGCNPDFLTLPPFPLYY